MARSQGPDLARLFHLNSSNTRSHLPDLTVDEDAQPAPFDSHTGAPRVHLPGADFDLPATLGDVLSRRESTRSFSGAALELESLGRLLFASYGVRGTRSVDGQWAYARPSPSAGGLYPIELYAAVDNVTGLGDGVYHYDPRASELEQLASVAIQPELATMTLGQEMIGDANVVVAVSAHFARTTWKYGQRGYRYVWLDAGHVAQNLWLVAQAMGLGVVSVGGFFDEELNASFKVAQAEVVYLVCVGGR
jgi:SagB-type dehydrogenase family enzyme